MKIRSVGELEDALNTSLAWRKKEILTLSLEAQVSRDHYQSFLCRSALVMLYAHWEGFVKECLEAYVSFLSRQGKTYRQLKPEIVALLLRSRVKADAAAEVLKPMSQLVEFFFYNLDDKPNWPKSGLILTQSNLMSDVLDDIFCGVGLSVPLELVAKSILLEARLVTVRHKIAHGHRVSVPIADLVEIKDHLLEALETVRTEIANGATRGLFLVQ